jgi:putative ABC transport system permease protein
MRIRDLINRSLTFYWRSHLAVVSGVAVAVAVLAGALLVGDSVRSSLRQLVVGRLGATDDVVSATAFFPTDFAFDLLKQDDVSTSYRSAVSLVTLEGVVVHDDSHRRAGGVQIYGIGPDFFPFHGVSEPRPLTGDLVRISPGLAEDLGATAAQSLVIRIEKPSAIPAESLHGRKENLGITLRATIDSVVPADALGEFALRPQQGAVRAIFVPIERLQRALEQDGKANTILFARQSTATSSTAAAALNKGIRQVFTLADLGLRTRILEAQGRLSLDSTSAVISETIAARARIAAAKSELTTSPVLTYLANAIRINGTSIPYSLVTALEPSDYEQLKGTTRSSVARPILLNDWAANDLQARPGAKVSIDYYVWRDEGQIGTGSAEFDLDGIVALSGAANDRDYAPDYPGITEAASLATWDPPFPVDLKLVRPKDEDYWHKYRTTPKAFILLEDGQKLWRTRYGALTSMRLTPRGEVRLKDARDRFETELRASIDPLAEGLSVFSARDSGLTASRGATDFGEYFTYFSFFIVVSALLLAALFFRLGVEQRLREIGTLKALGYSSRAVRGLFIREGLLLSIAGSIAGAFGAMLYAWLMLLGLRTWWVDAVGTRALTLHLSPLSLGIGVVGGILTAVICIALTLRRLLRVAPRSLLAGSLLETDGTAGKTRGRAGFQLVLSLTAAIAGGSLLALAWTGTIGQAAGFFGAGTLLLVALLAFISHHLRKKPGSTLGGHGWLAISRLGFRNASHRPGRSVLCMALVGAATFIIVSVDAFRRDPSNESFERNSGTGGYQLMAESLLPIVHNANSTEGREALGIDSLDEMQSVTFTRFRMRPGDDTSCLNLYQPTNPRILGAGTDFIRSNRFKFSGSLASTPEERANPWQLISGDSGDQPVPVIADANSLAYVLHHKIGEEMVISSPDGNALRLRIVGGLSDSVLQGEMIMSEENFLRHFPKEDGFRFFLIEAPREKEAAVAAFLEDRLSDSGFDATATSVRLASFHRVENTYLSTFQTLGGLGLLLGTIGLAVVLIRNVIERRRELALLRAVGYTSRHFAIMVLAENVFLLVAGLVCGFISAVIAILPAFVGRAHFPAQSLLLLVLVLATGLISSVFAVVTSFRSPLLPALRGE